jgi:hypothetical protein
MTTPNDHDCASIAIVLRNSVITFGGVVQTKLGEKAADRIEALTAERDAARAATATLYEKADNECNDHYQAGIAEGERRATAAIVADLRAHSKGVGLAYVVAMMLADRYERREHMSDISAIKPPYG